MYWVPLLPTTHVSVERAFPTVTLACSPPLPVSPTGRDRTYPPRNLFWLLSPWVSPSLKKAGRSILCSPCASFLEYPGLLVKRSSQLASSLLAQILSCIFNLGSHPFLSTLSGKPALSPSLRCLLGGGNGFSLKLGWGSLGLPYTLIAEPWLMLSRLGPTTPRCVPLWKSVAGGGLPVKWENVEGNFSGPTRRPPLPIHQVPAVLNGYVHFNLQAKWAQINLET